MSHAKCSNGHICQVPSGKPCIERGCERPAGTHWGPLWCPEHDQERLDRVTAGFASILASVDPPKETGPTCKHGYTEAHSYEQGPGPVDGWRCPGPHKLPTVQADRRRRELAEHEAKHGPLCGHTDAEGCTGHGDF